LPRADFSEAVEAVVVPKPKKKIPRITFAAPIPFRLADGQWIEIEKPLGCVLDTQTRQEILNATTEFLQLAEAESKTGLMDDAVKRTKRHRTRALLLVKSLYDTPELPVLQDYVDETIAAAGERSNLKHLFAELEWFVNACGVALDQMASTSSHHFWPDGFAWQGWIKNLTQIAESRQLPTAARKDTDKARQGTVSPFVVFVHRLQTYIPEAHRRSTQSLGALSTAINAARSNSKNPRLAGANEPFARVLKKPAWPLGSVLGCRWLRECNRGRRDNPGQQRREHHEFTTGLHNRRGVRNRAHRPDGSLSSNPVRRFARGEARPPHSCAPRGLTRLGGTTSRNQGQVGRAVKDPRRAHGLGGVICYGRARRL
jgi:hypothetical protein